MKKLNTNIQYIEKEEHRKPKKHRHNVSRHRKFHHVEEEEEEDNVDSDHSMTEISTKLKTEEQFYDADEDTLVNMEYNKLNEIFNLSAIEGGHELGFKFIIDR